MNTQIRDFDPLYDYPLVTKLINSFRNEPSTEEAIREEESHRPHNTFKVRKIAEVNGIGVGILTITRLGDVDFLWFSIIVDPEYRGKGIGSLLYSEGEKIVEQLGGNLLYCQVFDHMADSFSFAKSKGFTIDRHNYDSKLTITPETAGVNFSMLKEAEEKGFVFCSLADLEEEENNREKLHALYLLTERDIPGWNEKPPTFDEFCNKVFHHSGYIPEGQFIVKKGEEWVGMSTLLYTKETNSLYTTMTGVDPKYRGEGLATLLKMKTIQYAIDSTISYMLTHNDSQNQAMIAINRKLGYQPQPGYYRMMKAL